MLDFGPDQKALQSALALQHVNVREGMMSGLAGHLTCVAQPGAVPLNSLIGRPVSVGITTDHGQIRHINGLISAAQVGQSDGELCVYQLELTDALGVLRRRTNSLIFRHANVIDVLGVLFAEWRQRSQTLAQAFEFDFSGLKASRYPRRSYLRQTNETDAHFVLRLLRRDGITMFVRAGSKKASRRNGGLPVHTLVFCDTPHKLPAGPSGPVPLHSCIAGTEERDSITSLMLRQQLISGAASRPTWNYRQARMDLLTRPTGVNQGDAGNDLAALLTDAFIEVPHMADSWADHRRMTDDRILAHEAEALRYDGVSNVRDLVVGTWVDTQGDWDWNALPAKQRQFVITSLHHNVWNNLPKDLSERAHALFAASHTLVQPPAETGGAQPNEATDTRYENRFTCVPRGTSLTPRYDPKIDLPPTPLITGRVVGVDGDEVVCDKYGCVNVMILGQDRDDHAHAKGAGTNGNPGDSAPIRVLTSLAGPDFGQSFIPRKGMEVLLGCLGGDPDRLIILGAVPNGLNTPPRFSHVGTLPGNRHLSGVKTREINGRRYNQLRFDDTPGQISSQLASEHAHSELNLGYLTQPRDGGRGADRGEGAELRTDAAAALRAAQGILLTTYARSQASGGQLDRDELLHLLGECTELFKSLGDYAGQHGGHANDAAGQQAVAAAFKGWTPHDGAQPRTDASDGAQALMAFGAQAGSVAMTPKTHVTYAGQNIDQVAQQHVQLTSGQRISLHGGHGVAMFAHSDGISAIANQGKVTLQSQNDDTEIDSAKNIHFTAADGKLIGMSKDEVVFSTAGGAYLKLRGPDVELGCPGQFIVKAAGHTWDGPASLSADLPTFNHAPLSRVPKLVRATDAQPSTDFVGEVKRASGDLLTGQTDGTGRLTRVDANQFDNLTFHFFDKE